MMMQLLVLLLWCAGLVGSVAMHEAAHVAAGVRCGWVYHGLAWRVYGVGVKLDTNGHSDDMWKVAMAGPAATLALAAMFWTLAQVTGSQYAWSLATINLVVYLCNMLPIRGLDGLQIVKGLR
jgi:Zn-dependent protease